MKKSKEEKYTPRFEIVLQQRNHVGESTGKTISYSTDDPIKLEEFYQRNCFREKKSITDDKNETIGNKSRKSNKKNTKAIRDSKEK